MSIVMTSPEVVEDRILNGYNNLLIRREKYKDVVEDRILNGYNNTTFCNRHRTCVVEDRILNGYNNRRLPRMRKKLL